MRRPYRICLCYVGVDRHSPISILGCLCTTIHLEIGTKPRPPREVYSGVDAIRTWSLRPISVSFVVGEPTERRSKMGTCTCGKPTVWNDMCQDCNSEWDAKIYSYDDPTERAPIKTTFFSSDVLSLHMDMKQICGVSNLDTDYNFTLYYPSGATAKVITKGPTYEAIKVEYGKMLDFLKRVYK